MKSSEIPNFRLVSYLWIAIACLCFLCLTISLIGETTSLYFWNAFVLLAICFFTFGNAYWLVQRDQDMIWTPIFWFVINFGVHFGFGSMLILFGSSEAIEYVSLIFPTDQPTLLQINTINLAGFFITLSTFLILSLFLRQKNNTHTHSNSDKNFRQAKVLALLFLIVGISVRYFFILPYEFGLTHTPLPGTIKTMEQFFFMGLVLLSYLRVKTNGWFWNTFFFILLPIEATTSLMTYSKGSFLTIPILIALGGFLEHKNLKRLLGFSAIITIAYVLVTPIVSNARIEHQNFLEQAARAPFTTRFEVLYRVIAKEYIQTTKKEDNEDSMRWWARLCYANVQAFALHDISVGGRFETYKKLPYFFVPRFLVPDKPIMTEDGVDFTEMINGSRSSSTGLGVYMEGYWNGGVFGLLFFSIHIGLVMALFSYQSLFFIRNRKWIYLPLAFMAAQFGMAGTIVWFFPAFIGGVVLYFNFYFIFWILDKSNIVS